MWRMRMGQRGKRTLAVVAVAGSLAAGGVAAAGYEDDYDHQTASFGLDQPRPGRSAAQHLLIDYKDPDDPNAKPPAVRRVVTILPRGARYDTSVLAQCSASDAELMAKGAAACPPESALGSGVITIDTGVSGDGRFVTVDVQFFNNADELIFLDTLRDSGARTVLRSEVEENRTVTEAPMLPGTPPDGGAIDTVDIHTDRVTNGSDSYVTMPPVCRGRKADPHWTSRLEFTYADGVTQTVPTHIPCKRSRR